MVGRIVIEGLRPVVDCGQWPSRAVVGQTITVQATIFRDGHVELGAAVRLRGPTSTIEARLAPTEPGTDRWAADVTLTETGTWDYLVEAWTDVLTTWHRDTWKKVDAGQAVALELEEGARLLDQAARGVPQPGRAAVLEAAARLRGD